jgi:hypothetical protein
VLSLSDDEMLNWLSTWWVAAQTEAKGIPLEHCSSQLAEIIWLETLNSTPDSAVNADLLQVMKDIALGNRVRAAKMLREAMVGRAVDLVMFKQVAVSRHRQSERAKKERGDELTKVLRPWVERQDDISTEEVLRRLTVLSEDGHEAIREVTPAVIRVASQKRGEAEVIEEIRRSSIPSRLSRLRKK